MRARTLTVAFVAAATLVAGCVPETPTTPGGTATQQALGRAGDWILTQFDPAGAVAADPGNGVLGVANLAAIGTGPATKAARLTALEAVFEDYVDEGAGDRAGALARVIMAVVASGGNPRTFGGTDLVARLEATQQPSGLYGAQAPNFDGAFRQGLALAALSLVTPASPTIAAGVNWLRAQQCSDGSWLMYRASTAGECVENPATSTFKDSNGSALATLGLKAVGAVPTVDPTAWFTTVRGNDGGWGAGPAAPTTVSDADSTGLVIAALESLGQTPPTSAYDALLAFQLGSGAFEWKAGTGANRLATMDAVTALYDETWPTALRA